MGRACGHTCGCILDHRNKKKGLFVTNATGASLHNHQSNSNVHPNCQTSCPLFNKINTVPTVSLHPSESFCKSKKHRGNPPPEYTGILSSSFHSLRTHSLSLTLTPTHSSNFFLDVGQNNKIDNSFETPHVYTPLPESLSPTFSSYDAFISAYALETALVIEYRRVGPNEWEQLPISDARRKMSVSDWNQVIIPYLFMLYLIFYYSVVSTRGCTSPRRLHPGILPRQYPGALS
jgi:hypothetical protein